MKVAVVGATGLVGGVMLKLLEERQFPVSELIPVASEKSVGKEIYFNGKAYKICGMQEAIDRKPAPPEATGIRCHIVLYFLSATATRP